MTFPTTPAPTGAVDNAPRRPWLAALLSLLAPGLGQLYAGSPWRGLVWFVAILLAAVLVVGILRHAPGLSLIGLLPLFILRVVCIVDAGIVARRAPRDYALRPYNRWYIYLVAVVALDLIASAPRRYLNRNVERAFRIPSGSMAPTLQVGDFLMANLRVHDLTLGRGQVVIFTPPDEPGLSAIKRIVALPGDTVAMQGGDLLLNGRRLDEPYIEHTDPGRSEELEQRARMRAWQLPHLTLALDTASYRPDLNDWGPVVVPPDSLFILGDNRDRSYDSRYFGYLPRSAIIGVPWQVYYSYNVESPRPLPWLTAVRWRRIGFRPE